MNNIKGELNANQKRSWTEEELKLAKFYIDTRITPKEYKQEKVSGKVHLKKKKQSIQNQDVVKVNLLQILHVKILVLILQEQI